MVLPILRERMHFGICKFSSHRQVHERLLQKAELRGFAALPGKPGTREAYVAQLQRNPIEAVKRVQCTNESLRPFYSQSVVSYRGPGQARNQSGQQETIDVAPQARPRGGGPPQ